MHKRLKQIMTKYYNYQSITTWNFVLNVDICFIPMEELGGGADMCILAILTGDDATIQKVRMAHHSILMSKLLCK